MSSILQATDLVKSFGDAPVLGGLNLDVPEGSVYGLVGPNAQARQQPSRSP